MRKIIKNLVLGVSGSGTTFESIAKAIQKDALNLKILFVFADRECKALDRAKRLGIKSVVRGKTESINDFHCRIVAEIKKQKVDIVALAGYLLCFPVTEKDPFLVINSHPGAIPYFGGQGMYGIRVHEAVYNSIVKTNWIHPYTYSTIHIASEVYDKGPILGIIPLKVEKDSTPEKIAERLLPLEHQNYIQVLKDLAEDKIEFQKYPHDIEKLI